jgi:hypothetical protein
MSTELQTLNIAFVACIEGGVLEKQALLLFESIRRNTGLFRERPIYALSPRAGHDISNYARDQLDQMRVTYIDKVLNTECTEYGSANRVAAAAHIEQEYSHEFLVILDSDSIFLREPDQFLLPADCDVLVRPVDVKGMCTAGSGDPFDSYWRELCKCCGVEYDAIPWIQSFVDRRRIKASYNGGLGLVRTKLGILQRWEQFFIASVRAGLTPYKKEWVLRSGVSWVEPTASKFWGSNQAALSLAIWSSTRQVVELPASYNYPLHQHQHIDSNIVKDVFPQLIHVHYHWLFEEKIDHNPLFQPHGPLTVDHREWLKNYLVAYS